MHARALLVLLAVMNLGVALWWMAHPSPPPARADAATPAGVPELRLLSEDPRHAATAARAEAGAAERCYRFGPYSEAERLAAARTAAAAVATRVAATTIPGPGDAEGWRVVAPPPPDGDSAALATRVVQAGFDDYLLVAEGPEAGSVALGRFGTREAAERRRGALRDAGFDAQVHPVGGSAEWLQVALPRDADPMALRATLAALQAQPVGCDALPPGAPGAAR